MRYVQIRVGDTGRGIAKDTLPRIFDPFFTTRTKGTGLGLSITQSIIKEHGGFISVRSIESKGTTVLIDLPVERRHGERRRDP
jgi:signal transduction histidine kinase